MRQNEDDLHFKNAGRQELDLRIYELYYYRPERCSTATHGPGIPSALLSHIRTSGSYFTSLSWHGQILSSLHLSRHASDSLPTTCVHIIKCRRGAFGTPAFTCRPGSFHPHTGEIRKGKSEYKGGLNSAGAGKHQKVTHTTNSVHIYSPINNHCKHFLFASASK